MTDAGAHKLNLIFNTESKLRKHIYDKIINAWLSIEESPINEFDHMQVCNIYLDEMKNKLLMVMNQMGSMLRIACTC